MDKVVVITGASSGIGRATALSFARKGASLVLAARRDAALQELARDCEMLGGKAIVVPTDTSDGMAVKALAQKALDTYGRIDVWVNNAAVALFGRFEDTPLDAFRRLMDVNFFGYVYGARAALPIFRKQGQGVLINVASLDGKISQPFMSAYVASKHAVRGLSMSLRQELALDKTAKNIKVCTILPATIDTPLFQHAGNFSGRAAKAMPPVYSAEQVAEKIVKYAEKPGRESFVGWAGNLFDFNYKVAPGLTERLMAIMSNMQQLNKSIGEPPKPGNLFEPVPGGTEISGGWKGPKTKPKRFAALTGMFSLWAALQARLHLK